MSIQQKSRASRWAPTALVVGACAACCAVPLAPLVFGAGAATISAVVAESLEGLAIAGVLVLVVIAAARRRRARSAAPCASKDCSS